MTDMENQLTVIDGNDVFTIEEQDTLNQEIDRIISAHKNNRQEINRLVFECTAALTEADDVSRKLENKGFFRRLIGGITGSNKRLQDKINSNMRAAQYASQVTLQKLAEQNLMTFDLLTAVNNKLNASLEATNEMFKTQFMMMGKFFLKNRRDIASLDLRLHAVEKNVKLLNWQNSIEYLDFQGVEYGELDDAAKIACLVGDFYELTGGTWSTSDLLLLKAALGQVGISPHHKVNYFQMIKTIANTPALQQKLLGNQIIKPIANPSYLISLGTLEKWDALDARERYLVYGVENILQEQGIDADTDKVKSSLVKKYMKQCADVNLDTDVEMYDLLLDLLYNIETGKEEKLILSADQERIQLFLTDHTKNAFETIRSAAAGGESKALYMLAEYYRRGYGVVTIDEKLTSDYYKKSYEAGYPVAVYGIVSTLPENADERAGILDKVRDEIISRANSGDVFAQNTIGSMYYHGRGIGQAYEKALEWYQKAAGKGYAQAQFNLGYMYYHGQGVKQSYEKAVEWYQKAAEQGDVTSQFHLGNMYENGRGVKRSYERAAKWYQKAAEQGDAQAQSYLGNMYEKGQGIEQSYEKAVEWYQKSAKQGNADGQYHLGYMYNHGQGIELSYEKAVEWYQKSAEQGNADGQYHLGYMYVNGCGIKQSFERAVKWYRKAAEQGDACGQNDLGTMYECGYGVEQSYEKAVSWYRKSAEQGNADGQFYLGYMYKNGRGVEQSYEKAVKWYRKAAEQGNALAQNNLGNMHETGRGVEQSYEKAVAWYRKAAEQGNAVGQYNLGDMYEYGKGVEQSYEKAVEWYRKAAEQGDALTQYTLGSMYENGRGVLQSNEKARYWYTKAADQGYMDAIRALWRL
ncbi:SEL1-like repeat protein [Megasphaera elsdenii]|uniref:Sel1 repeat family protein n=1 Tax=Megasphaera elsdenii TaxID=907 RepID=A0A2S0M8J0_MEGEL|nr:tetratricopeptide repeat protein [Megasphaera elsdenii]AVO27790.1 sel1 repeat family protein [Megasphaera elsdenii]